MIINKNGTKRQLDGAFEVLFKDWEELEHVAKSLYAEYLRQREDCQRGNGGSFGWFAIPSAPPDQQGCNVSPISWTEATPPKEQT